MNPPVIADLGFRGDPAQASAAVHVRTGAGPATPPGRSMKRSLPLRDTTRAFRKRGTWGGRASAKVAKATPAAQTSLSAAAGTPGVRTTAWGERTGGVNGGPSGAGGRVPQPDGIIQKPPGGAPRRGGGQSQRRADRTAQPDGEPRAPGLAVAVRCTRCRWVARPTTDKPPGAEIPTVTAYQRARGRWRRWPWREAGLKPYWGKPTGRNLRGGGGNETQGLRTICPAARKGGYLGSHGPKPARASALLDG
jgi:hypothetical protein